MYVTVKAPPKWRQMTLDELLDPTVGVDAFKPSGSKADTVTFQTDRLPRRFEKEFDVRPLINSLVDFNAKTEHIRKAPRESMYEEFYIPKRSGGLRRIDAPHPELMDALRQLKNVFEREFGVLQHTSAFAYVKNRSTIDAVKRHQLNKSDWFCRFDLKDFFGSTTQEFVMRQFSQIFPFSEIVKNPVGRKELEDALSLAFLRGGLPQGTPISPTITNIMMVPIDHALSKSFREKKIVYTRYADDFILSSRTKFDPQEMQKVIDGVLQEFDAPFRIKPEKTRFGSSAGSNWILGVVLNQNHDITIGYKNKRRFESMLFNYAMDKRNGKSWDLHDVQVMDGLRSYYVMVEKDPVEAIIKKVSDKVGVDVVETIKADLRSYGCGVVHRCEQPGSDEVEQKEAAEHPLFDLPF